MIATIIILAIAFTWLGYETKWFTIRLESTEYQNAVIAQGKVKDSLESDLCQFNMTDIPCNKPATHINKNGVKVCEYHALLIGGFNWELRDNDKFEPVTKLETPIDTKLNPTDTPYYWMTPEQKEKNVVLCVGCRLKCSEHKTERWASWKLPAKTIKAFGSTLNLTEGCNIKRASFLKSMAREIKRKPSTSQPPLFKREFIYQERIGSHREFVPRIDYQTGEPDKEGRGYHQTIEDYVTKYRDCLPGKAWLKKHANDVLPEPTIELTIDGKSLSVNGNYKKGVIKEFVKANR